MKSITVQPEEVEACAMRIDDENMHYQQTFAQLFEAVDAMKAGWQGKDNTAFSNQIRKFEGDFREMSVLCTQYSEFLKKSARAYRETQDSIASQASNLIQ